MSPAATAPAGRKFKVEEAFKADAETYHILQALVEAKKEQLQELSRTMTSEHALLQQVRQDEVNAKRQLERDLAQRRAAFEKELAGERATFRQTQTALEQSQRELDEQRRESTAFIQQGDVVRAEMRKLVDARIEMERQRSSFEAAREQAERIIMVSTDQKATLDRLDADLTELRQRLEIEERDLANLKDALNAKDVALASRESQVALVKAEIAPKLAELSQKQEDVKERELRLASLQREAEEQRALNEQRAAELDGVRQQVDARLKHCQETEIRLRAWETDLQRKTPLPAAAAPIPAAS